MNSRLTFQGKCNDGVAWQKRLRDHYGSLHDAPPGVDLRLKKSRVRPVSSKVARQIILKYEWLGTMSNTTKHFGIFFGLHCAGVTCIGPSCTGGINVHKPFKIPREGLGILARGACTHWAPKGANSRLVSWSARLLSQLYKEGRSPMEILIAYSDTDAGEIGTVYQASNWVCIGKGSSTMQYISPKGKILDGKLAGNLAKQWGVPRKQAAKVLRDKGYKTQKSNPKMRYVCILNRSNVKLIDRVEAMRVEYPKRQQVFKARPSGDGDSRDTLPAQGREDGAIPISPLPSSTSLIQGVG